MRFLKIVSCFLVVFLVVVNLIGHEGIASDGEITLKEAIKLGLDRAKKWNENAYLTFFTSVDEDMGGTRGETGKRYNWNLSFEAPGIEEQLFIFISRGEVSITHVGKGPSFGEIILEDIKFDSSDLVKIAKEKYDLQKGVDWATGYHFTIDGEKGKPTIAVLGNDKDSLFARITFDAKNGEIVRASHKVSVGGGLIKARLGSDESVTSKKGMAIMGGIAENKYLVVWGDKKPSQFSTTKQPFIEWSHNNGETWTALQVDNYVTHAWFDRNDQLYVATEKEIWAGITSKSKGKKILSLDNPIVQVDYSTNNHIAVLSNGNIYYTTDQGESWEQVIVPKPFHGVQITNNGDLLGLTEERKILQKANDGWNEITMPNSYEEPLDMKIINNRLFITTKSGIWIQDLQEGNWREIKVDEVVVQFINKGEKLFGYTHRGEAIYSINTKDERKPEKVFDAVGFVVSDVDSMGDTLWIATIPDYSWEEMTISQRR
ncbi:WD40/YVTN/BNR-like repeat-containing protein [Psychrobacillus sp. NPDC096426]|uniref:WD40/YVTN/BNR-like repeat-containing protein n=1 Tax=Psychrobacillus sp. NPDC096426 TaxID=3364491 RepID=UPI003805F9C6